MSTFMDGLEPAVSGLAPGLWRTALALAAALVAWPAAGSHNPPALIDPIPAPIATGPFTVRLAERATGIIFPTSATALPDGSGRILVTTRRGVVHVIENGALRPAPFLDISATVQLNSGTALSSLRFHPDFAVAGSVGEGRFYTASPEAAGSAPAHFGATSPVSHQSVVYEWRVSPGNPSIADPASRREILRINEKTKPHNVNDLAFGPDGYLYISKGDDDLPASGSLDGTTVDGSILRIDVDDPAGNGRYTVPADNPFVGTADARIDEVFAYGFRNPWRMSFDPLTGGLYAGDNGEDDIEEIDLVQSGGYYGWNEKEGSFVFLDFNGVTDDLSDLPANFNGIDPVAEYDHTEGDQSIAGGFFYRGSALPSLRGQYVFGDFISGALFHMDPVTHAIRRIAVDPAGAAVGQGVIAFGETESGELLIVLSEWNSNPTGRVLELVGGSGPAPDTDSDGVPDASDDCTLVANPTQLDADGDGYGNICDADLNNSGLTTATDFNMLRIVLNQSAGSSALAAAADMNGSGLVTATDFNLLRAQINAAPGPSAVGQ